MSYAWGRNKLPAVRAIELMNESRTTQGHKEERQMSESRPESGPGELSRFRVVVVAALRVRQLRRGSKQRIESHHEKHKDTSIALEEIRRGLIAFTQFSVRHVHDPSAMRELKTGDEASLL